MRRLSVADVEKTLASEQIHQSWIATYYGDRGAERHYDEVFDHIVRFLAPPHDAVVLDAGCGNCAHAIRLAKRGLRVEAVDLSEAALGLAQERVRAEGLEERISTRQGSLTSLPYADNTFDYALCWGVLMHVPEVEKALLELARVVKPAGFLVLSENNMRSLDVRLRRAMRRLLGKGDQLATVAPPGIERWVSTPFGELFVRYANVQWMIGTLQVQGFRLASHRASHFTECYVRKPLRPLRPLIHGFNTFWFRHIKRPHLALASVLIFQKAPADLPAAEGSESRE